MHKNNVVRQVQSMSKVPRVLGEVTKRTGVIGNEQFVLNIDMN